jgi:hypothetical protein
MKAIKVIYVPCQGRKHLHYLKGVKESSQTCKKGVIFGELAIFSKTALTPENAQTWETKKDVLYKVVQ